VQQHGSHGILLDGAGCSLAVAAAGAVQPRLMADSIIKRLTGCAAGYHPLPDKYPLPPMFGAMKSRYQGKLKQHVLSPLHQGGVMLRWAILFFVLAVIASIFGFGGLSAAFAGVAKILFFLFVIVFIVFLLAGAVRGRRPPV
jgi:uncharacterized membrane protein YtjA (UPF0391 family)